MKPRIVPVAIHRVRTVLIHSTMALLMLKAASGTFPLQTDEEVVVLTLSLSLLPAAAGGATRVRMRFRLPVLLLGVVGGERGEGPSSWSMILLFKVGSRWGRLFLSLLEEGVGVRKPTGRASGRPARAAEARRRRGRRTRRRVGSTRRWWE